MGRRTQGRARPFVVLVRRLRRRGRARARSERKVPAGARPSVPPCFLFLQNHPLARTSVLSTTSTPPPPQTSHLHTSDNRGPHIPRARRLAASLRSREPRPRSRASNDSPSEEQRERVSSHHAPSPPPLPPARRPTQALSIANSALQVLMATMTAQWAPFGLEMSRVDPRVLLDLPAPSSSSSSSTTPSSSASSVASRAVALRIATLAETAEGFPSDVS